MLLFKKKVILVVNYENKMEKSQSRIFLIVRYEKKVTFLKYSQMQLKLFKKMSIGQLSSALS